MKATLALLTVGLAGAAFGTQDTITFARKYVEGEKDKYKFSMTAATGMGSLQMNMAMAQTVKKVYENGDADIETAVSDMKMVMNGNEMPMPGGASGPQASTARYNKHGMPVGAGTNAGPGAMGGMEKLMQMGSMLSMKPLTVGQSVPIELGDPKEKEKVTGTVKLESLVAGVAKIVSQISVLTGESPTPLKVATTSWVESATSKLNKVEGTVTDVPVQGGMKVDSVTFTMERIK